MLQLSWSLADFLPAKQMTGILTRNGRDLSCADGPSAARNSVTSLVFFAKAVHARIRVHRLRIDDRIPSAWSHSRLHL